MTNISKISGVLFVTQGSQNPTSYWGSVGNYQFSDDNTKVQINIGLANYLIAVTDLQVNGQTPANADEAKVLLNAVFPDGNSGTVGSTPTLDEVFATQPGGAVLTENRDIDLGVNEFRIKTLSYPSGLIKVTGPGVGDGALYLGDNDGAGNGTQIYINDILREIEHYALINKFNGVINLPTQAAPASPVDGDIWREDNTDTGLKVRINGVTKTISVT